MKISRGQIFAGILGLAPLCLLIINFLWNDLTANPVQAATLRTGRTAVNLLVASLACTPIQSLFGLTAFLKIRKTLGIFAFLYAALHFLIFIGLDFGFNLAWIIDEIRFKPFIQIGLAALVLLLILAITSFNQIRKKMGGFWQTLHWVVYPTAMLIILHFFLAAKGDISRPVIYAFGLLFLLLMRISPFNKIKLARKSKFITAFNNFLLH